MPITQVNRRMGGLFAPTTQSQASPAASADETLGSSTHVPTSASSAMQADVSAVSHNSAPAQDQSSQVASTQDDTLATTSTSSDLSILEQAIAEAERTVGVTESQRMAELQDQQSEHSFPTQFSSQQSHFGGITAPPGAVSAGAKETVGASGLDAPAIEVGGSVQMVEQEPNPELPPEVEGYINKVEQNADQLPKEIVIADISQPLPTTHHIPSQPVVVLPITPEVEKVGASKPPSFSVRWLVEWSHKIMRMFVGKVIYRLVKRS